MDRGRVEIGALTASTVAVTGVTGGLGRAVSTALAVGGARVILVCRDRERGEAVRRDVASAATGPEPALVTADLADLSSVRRAAAEIVAGCDHLEGLVNNAAVFARCRRASSDGYELMFATNHLGPFLLTNLLIDALRAAGSARVVTLSAPSTVALDFEDLQGEHDFKPLRTFGASKMANLLFAFELARRGERFGITSNAIHPGLVRTQLMREAPPPLRWATRVASRPPAKAAAAIVSAVVDDDPARATGQLLKNGKPVATSEFARDRTNQTRLWSVSCALTGLPDTA